MNRTVGRNQHMASSVCEYDPVKNKRRNGSESKKSIALSQAVDTAKRLVRLMGEIGNSTHDVALEAILRDLMGC